MRRALYLAAFLARRRNSALKGIIRERMQTAHKPAKVGIVAIARKVPSILKPMVRKHRNLACNTSGRSC